MEFDDLIAELVKHQALIVHCSREGKGDEGVDGLLYPRDLQKAAKICPEGEELSCSVVWPGHVETFGQVGIVLAPRSSESVTSVSESDSGTSPDAVTGKRVGLGADLSQEAVDRTFSNSQTYNEWTIRDAVAVGIFVTSDRPVVSGPVPAAAIGLSAELGGDEIVLPVYLDLPRIRNDFPGLPIYTIGENGIFELEIDNGSVRMTLTNVETIYAM